MSDDTGDVGFHRILRRCGLGHRAWHPENQIDIFQLSPRGFGARGNFIFCVCDVIIGDADKNNDTVGNPSREFEHLRPAGSDVDRHSVFTGME